MIRFGDRYDPNFSLLPLRGKFRFLFTFCNQFVEVIVHSCTSVTLRVMLGQDVAPEVAVEVSPHRVDVVSAVLRIVKLDQELGALDSVVVRTAGLCLTHPGEHQGILIYSAPASFSLG